MTNFTYATKKVKINHTNIVLCVILQENQIFIDYHIIYQQCFDNSQSGKTYVNKIYKTVSTSYNTESNQKRQKAIIVDHYELPKLH
jgi:hypothetical protein